MLKIGINGLIFTACVVKYSLSTMKKVIQEAYNVVDSACRLHWRLIKIQSAAFFAF